MLPTETCWRFAAVAFQESPDQILGQPMVFECEQSGAVAPGTAAGLWRRLAATGWSEPVHGRELPR